MPVRSLGVLVALLAGCGPSVETMEGGTSGMPGIGTTSGASSGAPAKGPGTGTTSGGSTQTTGSSSGSGEPPELLELAGVWRYNEGWQPGPISFQACDGTWTSVDVSTTAQLAPVRQCGGIYAEVRGAFGPSKVSFGRAFVVHEILDWRPCEPSDCGGDSCEPLKCLWECSPLGQDCSESDKCVPYPTDGGTISASACVPVPNDPDPLGASCTRDTLAFPSCSRHALTRAARTTSYAA